MRARVQRRVKLDDEQRNALVSQRCPLENLRGRRGSVIAMLQRAHHRAISTGSQGCYCTRKP